MKTQDEIQRAHDMMVAVMLDEVPHGLDAESLRVIAAQCAVLCWMLDENPIHQPGWEFGNNLIRLRSRIEAAGFEMVEAKEPFTGPPPGSPPRN